MRQFIIAALAAILAACGQQKGFAEEGERVAQKALVPKGELYVFRDVERGVTCYLFHGDGSGRQGLSCFPDSQLQQVAP